MRRQHVHQHEIEAMATFQAHGGRPVSWYHGLMRENMRACRDARARPSVHTKHRVVGASIVPRESSRSSLCLYMGGVNFNLRSSELLTGDLGDGDHCTERKSGGVRAQRGPEIFQSTIRTFKARFVLLGEPKLKLQGLSQLAEANLCARFLDNKCVQRHVSRARIYVIYTFRRYITKSGAILV